LILLTPLLIFWIANIGRGRVFLGLKLVIIINKISSKH